MTVYGWDLSNHDWDRAHAAGRSVDLADARKAGISFVTHKVTEGSPAAGEYADPFFDDFVRQLRVLRDPFPVAGSYHAAHRGHAVDQADFWFDTVTAKYSAWRAHPCWIWQIDAEPLDGYAAPTKADIVAMGHRLEALGIARGQIVVYGPRWVYGDSLDGTPWRLWASSYVAARGKSFKRLYPGDKAAGWETYSGQTPLIVQYSSGATIGAQHTCDANAVRVRGLTRNRSEVALQALFLGSSIPSDLLEEIMALPGAPKDYKTFLADVRDAVLNDDVIPAPAGTDLTKNPTWTLASFIRQAHAHAAGAHTAATAAAATSSSVATVVNALAPRVAQLQAAVGKLAPAQQAAVDVAAIAAAVADSVAAKLKGFVWGVK